jgi:hypothetical protein
VNCTLSKSQALLENFGRLKGDHGGTLVVCFNLWTMTPPTAPTSARTPVATPAFVATSSSATALPLQHQHQHQHQRQHEHQHPHPHQQQRQQQRLQQHEISELELDFHSSTDDIRMRAASGSVPFSSGCSRLIDKLVFGCLIAGLSQDQTNGHVCDGFVPSQRDYLFKCDCGRLVSTEGVPTATCGSSSNQWVIFLKKLLELRHGCSTTQICTVSISQTGTVRIADKTSGTRSRSSTN